MPTIEVFDDQAERTMPLALFPADRQLPNFAAGFGVQIRLKEMELHRPRQWGACWLACELYEQLRLDEFWAGRLPDSREGTCWQHILQTLVCYGLIDPGSEWRLHRQRFKQSAMGDLLDKDFSLVEKNALYRCLDKVLKHKEELFGHLRQRWQDLFGARFDVSPQSLSATQSSSDPSPRVLPPRVKRSAPPRRMRTPRNHRDAFSYLRISFEDRCAYSMIHINESGGESGMHVDHFNPRIRGKKRNHFTNLMLASAHCNLRKWKQWPSLSDELEGLRFLNCTEEQDYWAHLYEDRATGRLYGSTPAGPLDPI